MTKISTEDLADLLEILPPSVYKPLIEQPDVNDLIEVVLDLGRPPSVGFTNREIELTNHQVI